MVPLSITFPVWHVAVRIPLAGETSHLFGGAQALTQNIYVSGTDQVFVTTDPVPA